MAETEGPEKQLLPLLKHSTTHSSKHVHLRQKKPKQKTTTNAAGPAAVGGGEVLALPLGVAAESRPDEMDVDSGRRQVQVSGRASWVTADEGNGPP